MSPPSLDTLLLTEDELLAAREKVQEMAYFKWQEAGCPGDAGNRFWSEAELEWIEYFYVPHRNDFGDSVHRSSTGRMAKANGRQTRSRLTSVPQAD